MNSSADPLLVTVSEEKKNDGVKRRENPHPPTPPSLRSSGSDLAVDDVEVVEAFGGSFTVDGVATGAVRRADVCCSCLALELFLRDWTGLPDWQRDNGFIREGYRTGMTVRQALGSIFAIHNETGNIHTHLWGCVLFLVLLVAAQVELAEAGRGAVDRLLFFFFLAGVALCFFLSTTFHVLLGTTERLFIVFSRLDYTGIACYIAGSGAPILHYFFSPCAPKSLIGYSVAFALLFVVVVLATNSSSFEQPKFRTIRALLFTSFALLGVVPIVHFFSMYGAPPGVRGCLGWIAAEAFVFLTGAYIYASRFPERRAAGKFDIIGHSHQIFHLAVVIGGVMHYMAVRAAYNFRHSNPKC
jgi:adiponectin receptor